MATSIIVVDIAWYMSLAFEVKGILCLAPFDDEGLVDWPISIDLALCFSKASKEMKGEWYGVLTYTGDWETI